MSGCRPAYTPVDPNQKFGDNKGGDPMHISWYLKFVDELIYLSHTQSDIAFEASIASQFMHSTSATSRKMFILILRYLKSTLGFIFPEDCTTKYWGLFGCWLGRINQKQEVPLRVLHMCGVIWVLGEVKKKKKGRTWCMEQCWGRI